MKTIRYIFLTLAAATFVTACNDELNPNEINKANPGDEVQFSLSLPGKTKTVYGDETANEDGTNPRFPIYWVNGDKVKVASPQCQSGRNNAEYSVSVKSETQNYASGLTKTGAYGVQWGSEENADFYSIYPSTAGTTLNINGETVTATLHVDATQFANTSSKIDAYKKKYIYAQPAEMGNVVMYAKASASKSDNAVELHFTPFSTVLEFELTAPEASKPGKESDITIQSITLIAPEGTIIAGDFAFNFPTSTNLSPSVSAETIGGSNVITLHFLDNNQYTTKLSTEVQTLKAKMCVMPISGVKNLSGWKVDVATSAGTFSKNLTDQTGELKPGLVHKIKLPQLNYAGSEWVFEPGKWIPSLPDYRNIYLSELSLPGAWCVGAKLSDGYQNTNDIGVLWEKGVRAFGVECRSYTERTYTSIFDIIGRGNISDKQPSRLCISGVNGTDKNNAYTNVAGESVTYISSIISSIASAIKSNEYGVLILSYADGGDGGHRALDHSYFLSGIATEISKSGAKNICNLAITPKTTVEMVLGQLIVIAAIDDDITIGSYSGGMNSLICYNPFPTQLVSNGQSLAEPHFSKLYWKSWADANKVLTSQNTSDLLWCFTSANRTDCSNTTSDDGTIKNSKVATLSQRKKALSSMGTIADQIYDKSSHNVWFYFGAGGTSATSKSGSTDSKVFAKNMNPWLLQAIKNKVNQSKPSPLGIVMFNQCGGGTGYSENTYHGAEIIKNIIEMNSRFYLKHAGTSGGNTGGSTGGSEDNTSQNDSSFEDGGKMF